MPSPSIEIQIEGMTCAHCQRAVEQAISRVKGVDRVAVDLQLGKATVSGTCDQPAVLAAIEDEGYTGRILPAKAHHG